KNTKEERNQFNANDYKKFAAGFPSIVSPKEFMDELAEMIKENPNNEAKILLNAKLLLTELIKTHPQQYEELHNYLTGKPYEKEVTQENSLAVKFEAIVSPKETDTDNVKQQKSNLKAELTATAQASLNKQQVDP